MNGKIAIIGVNGKMRKWFASYFHKMGFEVVGFDVNNDIKEKFITKANSLVGAILKTCLLYTSPSPRDVEESRMPSSA